jgi:hypothetical protein
MPFHLALLHVAGAITWDPFIRGVLIIAIAFVVLPGSVYLLLATNTGVRVGFLLAAAGLTGWIGLMAVVWAIFGIGDVGRVASWKTDEIITGNIAQATTLTNFPKGFHAVAPTEPEFSDVSSAADKALASSAAAAPAPGVAATPPPAPKFPAPFSTPDQYVQVAHFRKDPTTVWHIRHHKLTPFGHDKHVDVVQAQAVLPSPDTGGAPAKPTADPSKPIISVVMTRDLGSVRQPPIFIAIAAFIIFFVICYVLHQRDKEIMAAKATGDRELVGAGRG